MARRILKHAALGACVLCAGVLPAHVSASDWPDPSLPDGTNAAAISSHLIYNGADMRSRVFASTQSAGDVVKFYRDLWGKQSVLNQLSGWQVVGHREGDFYITVQVRGEGSGSRGDIGIVRIPQENVRVELGKGVPRPANTTVFNDISYPDDPTPDRTLAMTNGLSLQQNAGYYREHLIAQGWKPADSGSCVSDAASCVMNYEQGDRKMTLAMTERGGHSEIVINVQGEGATP